MGSALLSLQGSVEMKEKMYAVNILLSLYKIDIPVRVAAVENKKNERKLAAQ